MNNQTKDLCNASLFRWRDLTNRARQQKLKTGLIAYLGSFPLNMQKFSVALWSEYHEIDSAILVKNVIRHIPEHYFMQACGYDGADIHKQILEDNRVKFAPLLPSSRLTKCHLVSAILSYIGSHAASIGSKRATTLQGIKEKAI